MKCHETRILKQLQIDIGVSVFPQDLNQLQQHRQLIASGQIGQQVDHVLKAVMVEINNSEDSKLWLKKMVDLVQVQEKNTIHVILNLVQVSF